MASYERDVERLSPEYKAEFVNWFEYGEPIRNRALYALLAGDYLSAIEWANGQADLADVVRMLRKHVPRGAWGDPLRVSAWEVQGGRECRPKPKKQYRRRA